MAKRDLRQMKKSGLNKDQIKKAANRANMKTDVDSIKDKDIKSVEDTIAKYENKSEGELMSDLERMVRQGRSNGSFSDEMLDSFIQNVSPMMNNEQRKKLRSLAEMMRKK